ncbi:MAG: hypothetical protein Q9169_004457 [Polycauliona sp. 2 TL-2023]
MKKLEAGGEEAAECLRSSIRAYLEKVVPGSQGNVEPIVRVYANMRGLGKTLVDAKILDSTEELARFVCGFNKKFTSFDFIDAGNGKECSDAKLKTNFELSINNVHCKHIIFGGSADNGYARLLNLYTGDPSTSKMITMLEGPPFATELIPIVEKFKKCSFPTVFRDTKITTRKVSFSTTPPRSKSPATVSYASTAATANEVRPSSTSLGSPKAGPQFEYIAPYNQFGQRVDHPIKARQAALQFIKSKKWCKNHYLLGYCGYPEGECAFPHQPALDETRLNALRVFARQVPCGRGLECDDVVQVRLIVASDEAEDCHSIPRHETTYHPSSLTRSLVMEPLSIAASVIGILSVTAKLATGLTELVERGKNVPDSMHYLVSELNDLRGCLLQLQPFLRDTQRTFPSRSAMISLDQVVIINTSCVLTLSELDKFVASFQERQSLSRMDRLRWLRNESRIELMTSLSLSEVSNLSLVSLPISIDEIWDKSHYTSLERSASVPFHELRTPGPSEIGVALSSSVSTRDDAASDSASSSTIADRRSGEYGSLEQAGQALGTDESGMSTIAKQMRIAYAPETLTPAALETVRSVLFSNLTSAFDITLESIEENDRQYQTQDFTVRPRFLQNELANIPQVGCR